MRTTVTLDQELLNKASDAAGTTNRSDVLRLSMQALIEKAAAQRLARLGGYASQATAAPRRRSTTSA